MSNDFERSVLLRDLAKLLAQRDGSLEAVRALPRAILNELCRLIYRLRRKWHQWWWKGRLVHNEPPVDDGVVT